MATRQRKRSFLRRLWLPALTAAYLGYFAFHAFHGYYGLWAKERMEAEAVRLSAELAELTQRRQALEAKAALLRPETLDPDMLDERARAALSFAQADELVIYHTEPTAPR